ncbi:MAG: hypothetical protein ABI091_20830 [Ferruginibacter sp.]
MKKHCSLIRLYSMVLSLTLIFCICSSYISFSQTAREIIDKHIAAIGGKAKLQAITSYSYTMEQFNSYYNKIISSNISYKKPGKWREDHMDSGKITQTSIYHGEKGWTIFDDGKVEPGRFGMSFENFLTGYLAYVTAPDFKIENLGPDTESDNLVLQIKSLVNNPLGDYYTFYINPATYLITKVKVFNAGPSFTYYFKDYKVFNGIQIPLTITQKNEENGKTKDLLRTKVTINIALDDKLFADPTPKK